MKKLTIITMILCLILCGCSNNREKTVTPTPEPTTVAEPTKAPTEAPTAEPTDAPTAEPTEDPTPTPDALEELEKEITDEVELSRAKTDKETYIALNNCIMVALTDDDVIPYLNDLHAEVIINQEGVTFKNAPDVLIAKVYDMMKNAGDINGFVTYKEYSLNIDGLTVTRTNPPVVPNE